MDAVKISVVIITFNEEKNIERCLKSVHPIADEIIVVDSFSVDNTFQICKKYTVKFSTNPFQGYVQQKNYAMELASHNYILSLDADEVLSPELAHSISLIKNDLKFKAYSFNRLTNYCGSWIHHCGWYPDRKIRLWNRQDGYWQGVNPHDKVQMNGEVSIGRLKGDLLHYSYHSISDHIKQVDKFTTIAAEEAYKKKKKVFTLIHIVIYPYFIFIKMYFFKLGFLDKYPGFLVCVTSAYYTFMKYAKLKNIYKQKNA